MSPKRVTKPLDIYVRVSDVRGRAGDSFISPDEQESRCRAAIASRGLQVGEVFHELDVSGKSMERPELRKVLERIESGVSGGIVVARIDRFGRTVARALDAIEEIDKAGGVVITAEGDFDTSTAVGELVLGMMLQLAQFELRRIRENWNSAQRRAVDRGVHISRHVPPGYRRNGDKRLEPHPQHGKTITQAFKMAAEGEPAADIARLLTRSGLPSGGNKDAVWQGNRVKRLLANRVYLGEARYGTITNPHAHKPLVDETTFLLAQRKSAPSVKTDSEYLLSGIVRCASCRHAMRPQKARGSTIATYRCATDTSSGRCPHPTSISMRRLDDFVFEAFSMRIANRKPEQPERDDSDAVAAVQDAEQAIEELNEIKDTLRPAAYAAALNSALEDLDAAKTNLSSRQVDIGGLVEKGLPLMMQEIERVRAGGRLLDETSPEGISLLRKLIAGETEAVFVRPAASRSRTAPIEDRVRIIWRGEEELELPQRGERFEPLAYTWNSL